MIRRLALFAAVACAAIPHVARALHATPESNAALGWFPAVADFGLEDYPAVAEAYDEQGYAWESRFEQAWYAIDPECDPVGLLTLLENGGDGRGGLYLRTYAFALADGRTGIVTSFYDHSALGYASMEEDYNILTESHHFADGLQVAMLDFSDPPAYGIGFFPPGIERLSTGYNGKHESSFVYTAACASASFSGSWGAFAVLGYGESCPALAQMTADSDTVFERMNGMEGIAARAIGQAAAGTLLSLAGDGAWVLAPTVVAFSPPPGFVFGNRGPFEVTCEFDTPMEQVVDPFLVTDGWMLADTEVQGYDGPRWLDDHTVTGWCVILTCPSAVGVRVDADAARSAAGAHRIDGGHAAGTIGVGPNGDDFRYDFSTTASDPECMSWATSFSKSGAFRDGRETTVYWAVDFQRRTTSYEVYAFPGTTRRLVATVPAKATPDAHSPAGYAVTTLSQATRFQIVERDADGGSTASRPFPLGARPPELDRILGAADHPPDRTEPILFPEDDLGGRIDRGEAPTAEATDYVFVVSAGHPSWESALAPVTARLTDRGATWQIVRTSADPNAIRGALFPIYQAWLSDPGGSLRPRVVLLGGGYEDVDDPRNILGTFYREDPTGACTFTPTCSCDQLLVDFGGDLLPELPLTRVPARTLEQVQNAVATFRDALDGVTAAQRSVVFMDGDMLADCLPLEEPTRTLLDIRERYQQLGYATSWLVDSDFECDDFSARRDAAVQAIRQNRPCDLTGTGVVTQRFVGPGLFIQNMIWPYWDQGLLATPLRVVGLFPGCDFADTDRINDWGMTIGETWTLAPPAGASASFWISHGRGHWGTGHIKWYREFMRWRLDQPAVDIAEAMFLAIRDVGTRCPGLRDYLTGVQALGWPVPLRLDPAVAPAAPGGRAAGIRVLANPASDSVALEYTAASAGRVTIRAVDVAGRIVATLARDAAVVAGTSAIEWDGRDASGRLLPTGVYTVVADGPSGRTSAKVAWLR